MKPSTATKHTQGQKFILSCFFLILILCILASYNEVKMDNVLKISKCAFSPSFHPSNSSSNSLVTVNDYSSSSSDEIRILAGILTLPDQYQKRHFLRMVYGAQSLQGARVDLKFIFCNLSKEDQKVLVALEIMQYNDIIILDCKENMNKGKTYTYFSSLPHIFNNTTAQGGLYPPYHYVLKADDDVFFKLDNLVKSLKPLPSQDLYYGFVIPCSSMDPFRLYMSGMGYLVSWDIVEWISTSDIPKTHIEGPEDRVFGDWMHKGQRGKNRFNAKWGMYNYPDPPSGCAHELWPDTIAVHLLKNQQKWLHILNYFNFTHNLKPSNLYRLPL